MATSNETLPKSQSRGKRQPYIPIPANFLVSPRVQSLLIKHGPGALGSLMAVIGQLRISDGYRMERASLIDWCEALSIDIEPLIQAEFLIDLDGFLYSPQLNEWMQPLEEIISARREAGRLGGRAGSNLKQSEANASKQKQSEARFISSPLILSDLDLIKGGVGGNPAPTDPDSVAAAGVRRPVSETPTLSDRTAQEGFPVIPSAPPKPPDPPLGMVEILPPEPEYRFPGCYLGAIEHDQIRVHTPDHLIRRAALIVRGHWIKNPQKPVKKFSAEITWALVEARKQAAENDLARSKAKRARDGPTPRTNEPIPIGKRRPANAID